MYTSCYLEWRRHKDVLKSETRLLLSELWGKKINTCCGKIICWRSGVLSNLNSVCKEYQQNTLICCSGSEIARDCWFWYSGEHRLKRSSWTICFQNRQHLIVVILHKYKFALSTKAWVVRFLKISFVKFYHQVEL